MRWRQAAVADKREQFSGAASQGSGKITSDPKHRSASSCDRFVGQSTDLGLVGTPCWWIH